MNNIPKIKKRYTKPELVAVAIDQEITLVMISDPGGGVTPPFGSSVSPSSESIVTNPNVVSQEDVFGGGAPVYSKD